MRLDWHTIVFDEELHGAAEYTYVGTDTYHGVAYPAPRRSDRQLAEYQRRSDLDWDAFTALNPF